MIAPGLREAENTFQDLAGRYAESHDRPQKAAAGRKHSLLVADAFSNPRHVQFAIKVPLAGMIGYLFYTASDYYGIHTVFYTPLILALGSTGATIHKGLLRPGKLGTWCGRARIYGCIGTAVAHENDSNREKVDAPELRAK
jgi:uncharacterized membrane protein YccC